MSRIGKRILNIPANTEVSINDNIITVKGPKGELSLELVKGIEVSVKDGSIVVEISKEDKFTRSMHGTTNANISNMLKGVSDGFVKNLEILGVGYRFNVQGKTLTVNAGYSHPVKMEIPAGLEVKGISNTEIEVSGIDKCKVGQFAAEVRSIREPEPYKGKGIRYKGEYIRRKEGKKASK